MSLENGICLNKINLDLVGETMARIESERLGVKIRYVGKRSKEAKTEDDTTQGKNGGGIRKPSDRIIQRCGTRGVSEGSQADCL